LKSTLPATIRQGKQICLSFAPQFPTPPASDVEITADFEFDVPVRFDTDHMAVTIETYQLHRWQQIPIVELRL
jgi:uncharacterized protein (TIGR02217 family)